MCAMNVAIVTGSAGLIGAEAVRFFSAQGFTVVGIDNDMRKEFFGEEASTAWAAKDLRETIPTYRHADIDVRDAQAIDDLFNEYGADTKLVIHTAGTENASVELLGLARDDAFRIREFLTPGGSADGV